MDDDVVGERLAQLRGRLQSLQVQLGSGHKLHAELQQCIDLVEGGWGEYLLANYYASGSYMSDYTAFECRFDRRDKNPHEEERTC